MSYHHTIHIAADHGKVEDTLFRAALSAAIVPISHDRTLVLTDFKRQARLVEVNECTLWTIVVDDEGGAEVRLFEGATQVGEFVAEWSEFPGEVPRFEFTAGSWMRSGVLSAETAMRLSELLARVRQRGPWRGIAAEILLAFGVLPSHFGLTGEDWYDDEAVETLSPPGWVVDAES